MSFTKNDQVFPFKKRAISEQNIAHEIASILRKKFGEMNSAVKVIGKLTGANPRAIRNWYEGRNAPSAVHLIMLAQHVPEVMEALMRFTSYKDSYMNFSKQNAVSRNRQKADPDEQFYGDRSVTINVTLHLPVASQLNQRQIWFIGRLQMELSPKISEISAAWIVSERTAKRDIAELVGMGLVRFIGNKRSGEYVLAG